jgi:hypothetical protein
MGGIREYEQGGGGECERQSSGKRHAAKLADPSRHDNDAKVYFRRRRVAAR